MHKITLTPVDTFFFRDAKSFNAGETVYVNSIFPYPTVIMGALRTHILKKAGIDFGDYRKQSPAAKKIIEKIGHPEVKKTDSPLKIKGPFISYKEEIFFPPPANLWLSSKTGKYPQYLYPKQNNKNKEALSNIPDNISLMTPAIKSNDLELYPLTSWLSLTELKKYLQGGKDIFAESREFFCNEAYVGHKQVNGNKNVEEGMLYQASHLRFEERMDGSSCIKSGLTFFVEGIGRDEFEDISMNVGGEMKQGKMEVGDGVDLISEEENESILTQIINTRCFCVYFATPAYFNRGWKPDNWPFEIKCELTGAAIERHVGVSGWDMMHNLPKPHRKLIPAGSVYFFKIGDDCKSPDEIRSLLNFQFKHNISDEFAEAGFGVTFIGSGKELP